MGPQIEQLQGSTTGAPLARSRVEIRWRIAARALKRARADLELGDGAATLRWRVELARDADGWRISGAHADLVSEDGAACRIEHGVAHGAAIEHDDLLHVDVTGLLTATLRTGQGSARLIYAWTSLLDALDLPAGTYEPAGCDVAETPAI